MKIVARKGMSYLIDAGEGEWWLFVSSDNEVYKGVDFQNQLTRGGWKETDGGALAEGILAAVKKAKVFDVRKGREPSVTG